MSELIRVERDGDVADIRHDWLSDWQSHGWALPGTEPPAVTDDEMTKAEIVAALEARGVEVDGRTGIAKLKEMLEALPAE